MTTTTHAQVAEGDLVAAVAAIELGAGPRPTPLAERAAEAVSTVVVDSRRMRPDMFEITFRDPDGTVLSVAGIELGTVVSISAVAEGRSARHTLIVGEVTAVEGIYGQQSHTVVRGYSQDHRLHQATRSRTFTNMTDADIATQVARQAGLTIGRVTPTRTVHAHLGQVNQTDWDFLCARATELGCDVGVRAGAFHFGTPTPPAHPPVQLRFPLTLRTFRPRLSAVGVTDRAEVRVWDPMAAKVVSTTVRTTTEESTGIAAADPGALARRFAPTGRAVSPPPRGNPALGDLGPAPIPGHVVTDRAVASGVAIAAAAHEAVAGIAVGRGGTVAEAVGETPGDPTLLAGTAVQVSGVSEVFCGRWVLSAARHVFDRYGYRTEIEVSGAHQRTLLGLAGATTSRPRMDGLICGIVSNIADPLRRGRVKVTLPLLSPGYETDWAPVAQQGAGTRSGTVFGYEVGDQVLVGHERGDPRRPYVLGGLVSDHSRHTVGGEPVHVAASASSVQWRGMVSPSGNRLAFHDRLPPGGASPIAAQIVLGTASGDVAVTVDQVTGTLRLHCAPGKGPGKVIVDCGSAGAVEIKAGSGGSVSIDGGARLNLSAQAGVKIESSGPVEIKGNPIKLN